ncbi:MAG: M67 family metallopeptidase [Actinobacteria bacterium]|nr:M67 family metallopeptidase [Actinomycetota bacterium]
MLRLAPDVYNQMVGHCYDGLPDEACGLLAGTVSTTSAKAMVCYPATNVDASSRTYTVDPKDMLRADRDAESRGLTIIAVFHSHTHTPAYPSPTDVAQAPDPAWHYVLVSLEGDAPVVRSYRIVDGNIGEEPVVLEGN